MKETSKVLFASLAGISVPGISFYDGAEPLLHLLLSVAQLAVAIVTVLYIYSKWRNRK